MSRSRKCNSCNEQKAIQEGRIVNGKFLCNSCLFEGGQPLCFYPIGKIHNSLKRGRSFHLKGDRGQVSEVKLFKSQKPFLYKLEDEKHITIVYYAHDQQE